MLQRTQIDLATGSTAAFFVFCVADNVITL